MSEMQLYVSGHKEDFFFFFYYDPFFIDSMIVTISVKYINKMQHIIILKSQDIMVSKSFISVFVVNKCKP